ncbi:hypothetical protein EDB87DRAFT_1560291 [Lactarius vividus]|nr:hypothetical protein EDB87DRAFT_1560291 [Lactarius vividus]
MTRGRRKDTTLPLSRGLIIQRAYRDRKAKYIADLEDRCRKAEEENVRLKEELVLVRSQSPNASINTELVIQAARACSDLMYSLQKTQTALSHFQQRALAPAPEPDRYNSTIHSFLFRTNPSTTELDIAAILTHALRQDPPAPLSQQPHPSDTTHPNALAEDTDGTECCDGLIDCEGLVE